MHRDYIKEHNPIRFNDLCLSGELWTYLADLNEQAQGRLELIIEQMKVAEGVTACKQKVKPQADLTKENIVGSRQRKAQPQKAAANAPT